ncbi:MAG: ATP-dependent DNA ligase [Myxococcales bacterium]|nr:ATP-dependent DNA ligase [Myxococcales bacterium]
MPSDSTRLKLEGKTLELSNLDKVLYPEVAFTKQQVIEYYIRIAPVLLPHLKDRPLTLKRYPEGVEGPYFYEKNCPPHRPRWVKTAPIYSEHREGKIDFCLVDDLPTLVWLANLAALELHPSLSLWRNMDRPTAMAFDLDPGPPADVVDCCEVALHLREMLEGLGLSCFPKTSGGKGLQVYVPLNTPLTYEDTKTFSRAIAELLERRHPEKVVSNMAKSLRIGKVLVDWSQNDRHKTTVSVYSLRARERPTASTPLEWEEVMDALESGKARLLDFDAAAVLHRVEERGDLFAPVLELKQRLPAPYREARAPSR